MRKIQGCFPPEQFLSLYCFQIFLMMKKRKTCCSMLKKTKKCKCKLLLARAHTAAILSITFFSWFQLKGHSSEIRGLCSTKSSNEILQNLPYFWNKKTCLVFFMFHFVLLYFSLINALQKYGKFWSISLGHFIKHKPLISEEWTNEEFRTLRVNFNHHFERFSR